MSKGGVSNSVQASPNGYNPVANDEGANGPSLFGSFFQPQQQQQPTAQAQPAPNPMQNPALRSIYGGMPSQPQMQQSQMGGGKGGMAGAMQASPWQGGSNPWFNNGLSMIARSYPFASMPYGMYGGGMGGYGMGGFGGGYGSQYMSSPFSGFGYGFF